MLEQETMARPVLYVAITNHGFGHATRTAAIVAEVQRLFPELLIVLTTTAPRWLLESYLDGEFIHRPRALDVGIIQSDSITMDKPATLAKLQEIQSRQQQLIAAEVNFIQQNRVGLVLADIPPLAAAIAHKAGIPCWMSSNFGWDFIYGAWGADFKGVTDWIQGCFRQASHLFRLPFHEPMPAFSSVTDTGLTGGTPRYSLEQLRTELAITTPVEDTFLLTFGGLGLNEIPYHNLRRFPHWQFITFDAQAPDLPNLLKIIDRPAGETAAPRRYRPVDLMPLCNRVVSKPGYGTFAEACKLGIPITSITRAGFAEAAVLIEGIQTHAEHQVLSPTEFFQGNWEFLEQPPQPPRHPEPLAKNGNQVIAEALVAYFQSN